MSQELRIIPITGIGEIAVGADLGSIIYDAMRRQQLTLQQGDVLVVTQKIVSKAEGRRVNLDEVEPSAFARIAAQHSKKDAQHLEVVLRESKRIVRMDYKLFSLFTLLGSAIWCSVLCYVGVKMGQDEKLMKGELNRISIWIGGSMLELGAMYYVFVHRHMKRGDKSP